MGIRAGMWTLFDKDRSGLTRGEGRGGPSATSLSCSRLLLRMAPATVATTQPFSSPATILLLPYLIPSLVSGSGREGGFVSPPPPPPPPPKTKTTTTTTTTITSSPGCVSVAVYTGSHPKFFTLRPVAAARSVGSYLRGPLRSSLFPHMCGDKKSADAIPPRPNPDRRRPVPRTTPTTSSAGTSYEIATSSISGRPPSHPSSGSNVNRNTTQSSTASSSSGAPSLASLRDSLSDNNPHVYSFPEISAATNNFLARRISASSSAWRCTLRDKDVVVVQRRLQRPLPLPELRRRLGILCKSHHTALAKLLGASISGDRYVYLVYEFVKGATLSECLRSPRNPDYTVLGTWLSRMQVAEETAHGLEYIHHSTGLDLFLVHNHIKSSTIILTDPDLRAKICHFGAADLTGETPENPAGEIEEEEGALVGRRSGSRTRRVDGTRGYMAPEIIAGGDGSQKSDVYAFGVVLLELLSGEEPVRYRFDRATGDYEKVSQIDMAAEAAGEAEEEGKLRRWIDRRLRDSYPMEVARKMTRLALECVHEEAGRRPDMRRVKGKISRLYLESKAWSDKMKIPTEFTVSLAGR